MRVQPTGATFGAVLTGVTLADLDDQEFAALHALWLEHALLIFPGQHLSRAQQIAFARRFGELEFEIAPLSNVRSDGRIRAADPDDEIIQILKGNMGWHADSTYMPIQAKGAVFTAHVVPSHGGETGWADMRAAYDALDPATRDEISGLSAFHSLYYSQARIGHDARRTDRQTRTPDGYSGYGFHDQGAPLRPLVKVHPETGRRSLLIGRHAYGIPGLPKAESARLLDDLVAFACQPPRTYQHAWRPGDAVLWDNRCLLHRGMPWDMNEPRVMQHSRIAGSAESERAEPRLSG